MSLALEVKDAISNFIALKTIERKTIGTLLAWLQNTAFVQFVIKESMRAEYSLFGNIC